MSNERRHHLNDYAQRYRTAARAGAWDVAKTQAIVLRHQQWDVEPIASCLYAEGYAREHLGDVRLASACYEMAVRLTGHAKAQRRLTALSSR